MSPSENGCTVDPRKIDFDNMSMVSYMVSEDRQCYRTRIGYNEGEQTHYANILYGRPSTAIEITDISFPWGPWDPIHKSLMEGSEMKLEVSCSGARRLELEAYCDDQYFSLEDFNNHNGTL